jgi:hypothetical protein
MSTGCTLRAPVRMDGLGGCMGNPVSRDAGSLPGRRQAGVAAGSRPRTRAR